VNNSDLTSHQPGRRCLEDQWIAEIFHPLGVRTRTISSAPLELATLPFTSRCVVLVDVAQATSPRMRTSDRAGCHSFREADIGGKMVRAILCARFDATENHGASAQPGAAALSPDAIASLYIATTLATAADPAAVPCPSYCRCI
jgi:hypothetical protein